MKSAEQELEVVVDAVDAMLLRVLAATWDVSPEEAASRVIHGALSRADGVVFFGSESPSEGLRRGH